MLSLGRRKAPRLLVADLRWSKKQGQETRLRFSSFEDDWNRPEMDANDAL